MFAHKILNHWETNIKQQLYYNSCISSAKITRPISFHSPIFKHRTLTHPVNAACCDSSLKIKNFTSIFSKNYEVGLVHGYENTSAKSAII